MQQPDITLIQQGLVHYPIRHAIEHDCLTEKQALLRNWLDTAALCYLSRFATGEITRQERSDALTVFFENSYGKYGSWPDMQIKALLSAKPKKRARLFDAFYVAMMGDPYPDCNPCKDTLNGILRHIDKRRAEFEAEQELKKQMLQAKPLPPFGVML